jgi:molybdate transport system substrate-binding protein
MRTGLATVLASMLLSWTQASTAQPLSLAAASDLQVALPEIARQFESVSGHPVRLTFGSSGNFYSQIKNGAPFDVFLSADIEYPRALIKDGKADASSLYSYGVGRLVVWARHTSGVDLRRGIEVTTDAAVRRIAIANPAHAPYGRAAIEALTAAGLHDRVRAKLVLGENVSQAAQFVQSGNAQVGLLALSLALSPALEQAGSYALIPDTLHRPILQGAVMVTASRHTALARQFLDFLESEPAVALLQAAGFAKPK